MNEKINPVFWIPESNKPVLLPGVPAVTLCITSCQAHFTVSPGWIVTLEGEKTGIPPSPTSTAWVVAVAALLAARTRKASNAIAPGAVCQGTFKTAANGIVHLHHLVFTYDTNGVVNGHIDETQLNTVSDDGNSYSGTFDQKFYDLDGNFLFELTGTQTATRITVER